LVRHVRPNLAQAATAAKDGKVIQKVVQHLFLKMSEMTLVSTTMGFIPGWVAPGDPGGTPEGTPEILRLPPGRLLCTAEVVAGS
jgi:hypothetical protein